jgi:hypothetical protein
MKIALTVDVETDWGGRINTVDALRLMIPPLLDLLDSIDAKATFFISSDIAHEIKRLILQIDDMGHEIASHGHNHNLRYDLLSKNELYDQARNSKEILEDIVGHPIMGFRTPQFRKNRYTEEVLSSLQYLYDSSSVLVSLPGRYHKESYKNEVLSEFPVGSIFRKLPAGVKWINLFGNHFPKEFKEIFVVYVHLFDLLPMYKTILRYSPDIKIHVLLFYLARLGNPLKTLEKISRGSMPLCTMLPAVTNNG